VLVAGKFRFQVSTGMATVSFITKAFTLSCVRQRLSSCLNISQQGCEELWVFMAEDLQEEFRQATTSKHSSTDHWSCPGVPGGAKWPLENPLKPTFVRSVTSFHTFTPDYKMTWECCVMSLGVLNNTPCTLVYLHQKQGFSHFPADLELP